MESEVLPKNGLPPICLTEDNLLPLEIKILKIQLSLPRGSVLGPPLFLYLYE